MDIKVYGCRGSAAYSRNSCYGGNTSCISLQSGGDFLVIDAGSGLITLGQENLAGFPVNILLSHLHLDHIIGLGTFPPVWHPHKGVRLYTCSRDERPLKTQICAPFAPPYWPAPMEEEGHIECVEISADKNFQIGVFTVTPFMANHPNRTLSYHVTDGHKSLTYLLDNEMALMPHADQAVFAQHCQGADLVIFDAAYGPEDYEAYKGWGHSTVKEGVEWARKWGCKAMLFSHYDQKYSDAELDAWAQYFPLKQGIAGQARNDAAFIMAKDGLELHI